MGEAPGKKGAAVLWTMLKKPVRSVQSLVPLLFCFAQLSSSPEGVEGTVQPLLRQ